MITQFNIGNQVEVSEPDTHEFLGTIISMNNGYIQVRDQDDDVFDVSPENCKLYDPNGDIELDAKIENDAYFDWHFGN